MTVANDEMVNLRAALSCEYAANALRSAHTFESAAHIYGTDTSMSVAGRAADGVDNIRKAAALLGFTLTPIINNMEDTTATEPTHAHSLSTAGGFSQQEPSALQDVFEADAGYSRGLSGRLS